MPLTYVNAGPPAIMPGHGLPFSLPNGGKIAYVHSSGAAGLSEYPSGMADLTFVTLGDALNTLRANRGDRVVVLPGHSESVTANTFLANLKAGVSVEGAAWGGDMPAFRWTNTGGEWTIDDASCVFKNLRLRLEGANGVTKAINITAADVQIIGCDIETASGASNKATIVLEVGSAALRCSIVGNRFRGTETHNSTDGIKVVGATTPDDLCIADNEMVFSATAANGLVNVTVAAKRVKILRNVMYNTHTSSTACVAVGNVAADGIIVGNVFGTKNDGTANAQGVTFGASALFVCGENYSVDEAKKSGVITPAVVAT